MNLELLFGTHVLSKCILRTKVNFELLFSSFIVCGNNGIVIMELFFILLDKAKKYEIFGLLEIMLFGIREI